jgi:lipoprotein-releasing system permease protein
MALIIVLSVMNGFEEDIKTKILGTQSHIVISSFKGGISDPASILKTVMKEKGVVAATDRPTERGKSHPLKGDHHPGKLW